MMESSTPSEKNGGAKEKEEVGRIKDIISTLPVESGWKVPLCLYQGHWNFPVFTEGTIFAQRNFKPQPDDIFVCSAPKTGTTWLKALTFATLTRNHCFNNNDNDSGNNNPLLSKVPHDCIPLLEEILIKKKNIPPTNTTINPPLWSTHIPYSSLPKPITQLGCKIIYIWRDPKDAFVSLWHFINKVANNSSSSSSDGCCSENISLEEPFELFCKGISTAGPYWDHVLGYWKASLERPDKVLFLKYEEMMEDTVLYLKKLAKFVGYPFSPMEEEGDEGSAVEKIVEFCSFDNMSNLDVSKTGKYLLANGDPINNQVFYRKGKVGDWKNYLSFEMGQRLDHIMREKLNGSGLKM